MEHSKQKSVIIIALRMRLSPSQSFSRAPSGAPPASAGFSTIVINKWKDAGVSEVIRRRRIVFSCALLPNNMGHSKNSSFLLWNSCSSFRFGRSFAFTDRDSGDFGPRSWLSNRSHNGKGAKKIVVLSTQRKSTIFLLKVIAANLEQKKSKRTQLSIQNRRSARSIIL